MIKRIRLVGCQSWEDATISLSSDKINIVRAPNQTGKSVLFKMFKISVSPKFYPPRKRKKLIRWGCDDAKAIYEFTDGSRAAVIVQPTKTVYMFRDPGEERWETYLEPPAKMIKELGFLVNSNGTFIANIIDTDQNLMLVDANSKATDEFINLLCNNADIDDYSEKVKMLLAWANNNASEVTYQLNRITSELRDMQYVDVNRLQNELNGIQAAKRVMSALIKVGRCMNNLSNSLEYARDYDRLEVILNTLTAMESIKLSQLSITEYNSDNEVMLSILEKLEMCSLDALFVEECKVDDRILEILERLESIQLQELTVVKKPPSERILSILEKLEYVHTEMQQLQDQLAIVKPVSVNSVNLLEKLEMISTDLAMFSKASRTACMAKNEVERLTQEFLNSGAEHKCEIYGKVVFDGKTCVPCDY